MRAVTIVPAEAGSLSMSHIDEPAESEGAVLVDVVAVGLCGTDMEIVAGEYGQAPAGREHLVLGHESLGRVRAAPPGAGVSDGDLVVAMVRRPDPVPCENCAAGQWDMCRNGRYTEHGIKGDDGFMRERYRVEADRLVRVDPALGLNGVLLEPASVVAKAWAEVDRIAARAAYRPRVAVITGAGPIGLLAALLATQRGLEVHVLDLMHDGPKPDLVRALGATYHDRALEQLDLSPDVVIECTGVPEVVVAAISCTGADGITALTGVSTRGQVHRIDLGGLNRELVLQNDVVLGSVNARRIHYEAAAASLGTADSSWLAGLLTRRVPLDRYQEAFTRDPDDIKVILDISPLP